MYYNARSLLPKIDELRAACLVHNPDIICITETWLDESVTNNELCIQNFDVIRLDRNRHGGGILIYLNNCYSHSIVFSGSDDLELIVLAVNNCTFKITLGLFYRPPSSSSSIFDMLLTVLCAHINVSLLSNFILVGDFNVNVLNRSHPLLSKLQALSSSLCLSQVVSEPTHLISDNASSLIDLIYLSVPSSVLSCTTIPPLANSDHLGLYLSISAGQRKCVPKVNRRKIWRYALGDFDRASELLLSTDWNSLFSSGDINICWLNWKTRFLEVMQLCIPQSTVRSSKNLPWLNKQVIQAIRKRNALFRKTKKCKSPAVFGKYRAAKNKVTALIRLNKKTFFQSIKSSDTKNFWKAIKLLTRKDSNVPTLVHNDSSHETSSDKANLLNNYFHSCFNKNVQALSPQTPTLDSALFPQEYLCTEDEVFDLIAGLDDSKSSGPDGISVKMLKGTITSIVPSLTALFNLSLSKGIFPADWKLARVVPIPKATEMSSPTNYRPISILSILSKIIERHIHRLLFDHLCNHYPISAQQWGFLPGRSTSSALIYVIDDWLTQLDNRREVYSVFFDIRKAFDSVSHELLLSKLARIQVNPFIIEWIRSYLTNRSQKVVVDGEESSVLPVLSGIPQGSVLGPLLFILFINDVTLHISPGSRLSLFADDMTLFRTISTIDDYWILQCDVTAVASWIEDHNLSLQPAKCCSMVISRKRSCALPPPTIFVGDWPLAKVSSVKYLGVHINSDLSWSTHINNLCCRARRLTGLLYRQFYNNADTKTLLQLYKTFIRPHLEYCSIVWDPYLSKDREALEKVQRFGLRVCLKKWDLDQEQLLLATNMDSLADRRSRAKLSHLYKIMHDLTDYPDAPLSHKVRHYDARQENSEQLIVPRARTLQYQRSYFPDSILKWNSLPSEVTACSSLSLFRKYL